MIISVLIQYGVEQLFYSFHVMGRHHASLFGIIMMIPFGFHEHADVIRHLEN